jgi:hypothetical protein
MLEAFRTETGSAAASLSFVAMGLTLLSTDTARFALRWLIGCQLI